MTTTTQAAEIHTVKLPGFETETCSRCCGSGRYSYCTMYGDTCFKCSGSGKVYTKRGLAAKNWLKAERSIEAKGVTAGDYVRDVSAKKFEKVLSVKFETREGASLVNGAMVPYKATGIVIETSKRCLHTFPNTPIEVFVSNEHHAYTLRAALAYQDCLTKSGQLRKVGKSKSK